MLILCFADRAPELVRGLLGELYNEQEIAALLKEKAAKELTREVAVQTSETQISGGGGKRRKIDNISSTDNTMITLSPAVSRSSSSSRRELSAKEIEEAKIAVEENQRRISLREQETRRMTSPLYMSRTVSRMVYVAKRHGGGPEESKALEPSAVLSLIERRKARSGVPTEERQKGRTSQDKAKTTGKGEPSPTGNDGSDTWYKRRVKTESRSVFVENTPVGNEK